ncbi:MAG: hypothetical protein GX085_00450 [Firmicutes bacterium]|nr:hypothetical protein [Bacillota bacterium]
MMFFDPITLEGLSLLNEFCQVFAPLKYREMSLARVLFYDYLRFLCNLPQLVERRRELGDLPSIPWARLQASLVGCYPETHFSGGPVLIEGPMASYIPEEFQGVIITGTIRGGAVPPGKDLNHFRREMGELLHSLAGHPIFGHPRFRRWFVSLAEKAVTGLHGTWKSKERIKPSCVAYQGNNYLLPLRILSEVCRASGIPSVAYHPLTLRGTSETAYLYHVLPLLNSAYFCWGEEFKEWMVRFGVEPKAVIPTGCPRFDSLPLKEPPAVPVRTALGLTGEEILVLADQQVGKREAIFRMVWEAVKKDPRWVLVVKLHPHHEKLISSYKRWSGDDPRIRFVPPVNLSLYDLLAEASAVVTYFSTVGVEAAFYRVPVITPVFPGTPPSYLFYKTGGAIPVHSAEELGETLKRLRTDRGFLSRVQAAQEQYLSYVTIPDGNSTRRFFASLLQVARGELSL